MGAKTAISVAEYLRTSYPDLDREYRDGEVLERSTPDYLHSRTQVFFAAFFLALQRTLGLYACSDVRLQLAAGLFRIPDISVFREPQELATPDTPPFIVAEILSPDDRMSDVLKKLEEYRAWGVPHVWLVDPHTKRLFTCDDTLTEVPTLQIAALSLEVKPSDIFE